MSQPAVLACAILTSEIGRQSAEIDARFAASEAQTTELVASSRESIERSRDLLSKVKAR
jgi:hypothetical protein